MHNLSQRVLKNSIYTNLALCAYSYKDIVNLWLQEHTLEKHQRLVLEVIYDLSQRQPCSGLSIGQQLNSSSITNQHIVLVHW